MIKYTININPKNLICWIFGHKFHHEVVTLSYYLRPVGKLSWAHQISNREIEICKKCGKVDNQVMEIPTKVECDFTAFKVERLYR